jgi:hypothetical protein
MITRLKFPAISRFFIILILLTSGAFVFLQGCNDSDSNNTSEEALIDPEANPDDAKGVVVRRSDGDRRALYVYISGSGGGAMGYALHLYEHSTIKYARFLSFQQAIQFGNNWVVNGGMPKDAEYEPYSEERENRDEGDTPGDEVLRDFAEGNIRATVAQNKYPVLTGYHVNVYVDNVLVSTVYKDCNFCSLYNETTANSKAQTFVTLLQGWTR